MSAEDILSELKNSYISNFPNQTSEIEQLILDLEKGAAFKETFEALYRRVHSIKGSAGTFGFSIISSICHQMEDYINENVTPKTYTDPRVCNTLFEYLDLLVETRDAIVTVVADLPIIEKKLESIGKKSTGNTTKCLCVGLSEGIYNQIIHQAAKSLDIHCSFVNSGLTALERLLHEHFDLLITSRENVDINGVSIIAALKLNKRKNVSIKSVLLTSNPNLEIPQALAPNFIIAKDKNFASNLLIILEQVKTK